jgi:hypothetical protein
VFCEEKAVKSVRNAEGGKAVGEAIPCRQRGARRCCREMDSQFYMAL